MTALHWAAFHNRPEHLRYLLQRGANTLTQDIDGKTPLHWAAQVKSTYVHSHYYRHACKRHLNGTTLAGHLLPALICLLGSFFIPFLHENSY